MQGSTGLDSSSAVTPRPSFLRASPTKLVLLPLFHRMAIRDLRAHSRARAELGLDIFFLSFLTHSLFSHHSPAPLPSEEAPR